MDKSSPSKMSSRGLGGHDLFQTHKIGARRTQALFSSPIKDQQQMLRQTSGRRIDHASIEAVSVCGSFAVVLYFGDAPKAVPPIASNAHAKLPRGDEAIDQRVGCRF